MEICALRFEFNDEPFTALLEYVCIYEVLGTSSVVNFVHILHEQRQVITKLLLTWTTANWIYARNYARL